MNNTSEPIVIIGAGLGGLSAAIRLAAAGLPVLVLEQNDAIGGKMAEYREGGFRWDTGPSLITMRDTLEDLFATAGRDLSDYLTLTPIEPTTRYFYPDGTVFSASRELPRVVEQIAQFEPRDVEGYLRFLSHTAALDRITSPVFIRGDPPTLRDIMRVPFRDMLHVDAWRSMDKAICAHVRSPYLRNLFRRFATYIGADPYRAPAVLNVIAHVELTAGLWYPKGGIYRIANAYRELAEELGVEIRTNARVTRILTRNQSAQGVVLADGTQIMARAIVANVDVTTVYHDLLPHEVAASRLRRLLRIEPSVSGFVLLLGVEGDYPQLAHHNILFPTNYAREFEQIFNDGIPPQEPTVYIAITSKADPDHAPEGCENWFVLINAPPLGRAFDWETQAQPYRDLVLDRMAAMGLDIRNRIRVEHMLTPIDLKHRTGAWRGALYGLLSNSPFNALRRPHNRDSNVHGLYYAGGATHPGGGVPMVTLSGAVASRMLLEDLEKQTH